ncbi:MAG: DUF1844 domain-containing protein [Deltaproteobacteria bacterium]|nr:DUF1844 domain-containing protein [Deltaproteobacteria bacterium]
MAEKEEKGFVIKDRRSFDEKGDLKKETAEEEKRGTKEPATGEKSTQEEAAQTSPLPEVNFNSLIFSLSSSALFHLGEIADPQTGEKKKDLPLAKHAIDTIDMLEEKTRGNLSEEEAKFIENVLTDLRWRYVKAAG